LCQQQLRANQACQRLRQRLRHQQGLTRDAAGRISTDPAYTGANFSQWYGFGRIDAAAAVAAAASYLFTRDIVVRDNLADNGLAPSTGVFWKKRTVPTRNSTGDLINSPRFFTAQKTSEFSIAFISGLIS
jgi:hypothetical protein